MIIDWLIHMGWVSDERQAKIVLGVIVALSLIVSIYLFTHSPGPDIPPEALVNPDYGLPIKD